MSENKRIVIIGGGTVAYLQNHLALCAPAYGMTALSLQQICKRHPDNKLDVDLYLTKMAGGIRDTTLETNEDVEKLIDELVADLSVKIVFFNVALVDYQPSEVVGSDGEELITGKYTGRIKTRENPIIQIRAKPSSKLIGKIRKKRKDIFLVGFKTTCGVEEQEQYLAGLNLLKEASCNLVFANDTKTRVNMIITPEEAAYHVTDKRIEALENLVDMAILRSHLTFTRSTVVAGESCDWEDQLVPNTLREVVNYCVKEGAYKVFRGATVGHFAVKLDENTFLTSKRKTNFNDLKTVGLVKIKTDGPDSVFAYGAKPSVGGQSQRIVFSENPEYDCIVHFHSPKFPNSDVPTMSQREYECGSHECGKNTANGLQGYNLDRYGSWVKCTPEKAILSAVYLDNHGPNIVFNSKIGYEDVIDFIAENFDLAGKTGGYTVLAA